MKILLLGKNGQLGFELAATLAVVGEVAAVGSAECDLADAASVRALVRAHRPDVIVNAAAYTAVDRAEQEVDRAMAINGVAPGVLGDEARALGALVVHYSTDYVFDGRGETPFRETDAPNPLNVYGRSKLIGEQALAASGADHLIFRISWVMGAHGNNFAKVMLRLAKEREQLRVVADQVGAPTSAALVANATAQVVRGRPRDPGQLGVFHLVAAGETNWCETAKFVLEHAAAAGVPLKVQASAVTAITSAEYPTPAARPANSRLDTTRFRAAFGLTLPPWTDGLAHTLRQIIGP